MKRLKRKGARVVVQTNRDWLKSEQDCRIFIDALMNPPAPNIKLINAMNQLAKV